MSPVLNAGTIETYFNDISIVNFLSDNLDELSGTVLDIGCGKMKHREMILKGKGVKKYVGLDLEEGKFTYSVKADMYWDGIKIPLDDKSVDSIILFEVIEHCPNPSIVINEAYRVLKPGGIILFSTPFLYHLHGAPYDYSRPTPFGLKSFFDNAGFSNTEIKGGGNWDSSLGQMIALWISHRPMNKLIRKVFRHVFVPIFKLILIVDRKYLQFPLKDGTMIPNLLGKSIK